MITIYKLDGQNCFAGAAEVNPMAAMPRCTLTAPPAVTGTEVAQWRGNIWVVLSTYPVEPVLAPDLPALKAAKNAQINNWRATANQTYFTHLGKQIACDELSRSDIDAVAGSISLNGAFPAGFPGAWKAMDNSYLLLPDLASFKAMYASMTTQGTVNFGKSQTLKTQLAAATTVEQINALVWS